MNKEKVKPNVCPIEYCGRPLHKKSEYCIFHAKPEEKTEKEFKKALEKYLEKIKENNLDYNFIKFIFVGDIDFREDLSITIFKNANFFGAIFGGDADFGRATFKKYIDFRGVTFEKSANFGGAIFEEEAFFENVTFEGIAFFNSAIFEGYAAFAKVTFKNKALFIKATFQVETFFADATFKRGASFIEAIFEGEDSNFLRATFVEDANFKVKYFINGITFEEISVLPGQKLNLKAENSKGTVSFKRAFLENAYLDIDSGKDVLIDFTDALLRNTKIEGDQIENHIIQEEKKEFSEAKQVYLLLKNNFHSIGRYDDESWAFKKEKDMERKGNCHFKTLHKWLWSCFLNGIFGYGEQPGKVIISAISIILIFTFLFMSSGISDTSLGDFTSKNFLDCVYFSVITFTTLGYGDFRPLEGCGRIFAGTEAFIGALMMALFVYTFARRTGGS